MASMISYFGCVSSRDKDEQEPSSAFRWDGRQDLASNLTKLGCPVGQLKVLLDQALGAAYYLKFYGPRCHEVINDYIEELTNDITYRFTRSCARTYTDNFLKIYNTLMGLVKFLRGGNWSDVDIALVKEFLFDGTTRTETPVVFKDHGTLVPFLMWMNRGVQPEFTSYAAERCGVMSFHISTARCCEYECDMLSVGVCNHAIGRSFSVERTPLDQLTQCPLLGFLSHFDWTTTTFEAGIGIISEFCLHEDIERYGISLSHQLAYCLRISCVFPRFDIRGVNEGIEPVMAKYHEQLFNAMLAFVAHCSQKCGMDVVDRNIVAKAFGVFAYTKEQRESVAYLRKCEAVPSADELKSFKKVMGCVESLQLISQNPTLTTAQASNQVTGSTEATEPGKGEAGNKPEPTKGTEDPSKADKGQEAPKKEEGTEGDDSKPTDDDDGADDTNTDDTMEEEPATQTGADDGNASPGGSGDPSVGNEPSTQTGDTPEEVNTSDDKGIEFEFAIPDSSTVDSVLFREEMYKFLKNVLTNPPKCLSPQAIETLTALRQLWLSCLSIETIKGIVEACIRLPKSIKHSIHKSTELQK